MRKSTSLPGHQATNQPLPSEARTRCPSRQSRSTAVTPAPAFPTVVTTDEPPTASVVDDTTTAELTSGTGSTSGTVESRTEAAGPLGLRVTSHFATPRSPNRRINRPAPRKSTSSGEDPGSSGIGSASWLASSTHDFTAADTTRRSTLVGCACQSDEDLRSSGVSESPLVPFGDSCVGPHAERARSNKSATAVHRRRTRGLPGVRVTAAEAPVTRDIRWRRAACVRSARRGPRFVRPRASKVPGVGTGPGGWKELCRPI